MHVVTVSIGTATLLWAGWLYARVSDWRMFCAAGLPTFLVLVDRRLWNHVRTVLDRRRRALDRNPSLRGRATKHFCRIRSTSSPRPVRAPGRPSKERASGSPSRNASSTSLKGISRSRRSRPKPPPSSSGCPPSSRAATAYPGLRSCKPASTGDRCGRLAEGLVAARPFVVLDRVS